MTPNIKIIIIIAILAIIIVFIFYPDINNNFDNDYDEGEYPSGCENLSLEDTSYCLRDFTESFFNYRDREDTPKSAKDVIENGGDCYDYSLLYQKMFDRLGFRTYIVSPFVEETEDYYLYHQYLRVEDKTGYCIIDMIKVMCFTYGEPPNSSNSSNSSIGTKMAVGVYSSPASYGNPS